MKYKYLKYNVLVVFHPQYKSNWVKIKIFKKAFFLKKIPYWKLVEMTFSLSAKPQDFEQIAKSYCYFYSY